MWIFDEEKSMTNEEVVGYVKEGKCSKNKLYSLFIYIMSILLTLNNY